MTTRTTPLATQMADPETNCLLLMFDAAQSVRERSQIEAFSFRRVGIQAVGHTTVLRVNFSMRSSSLSLALAARS